jgi:glutamine cyclotransferase
MSIRHSAAAALVFLTGALPVVVSCCSPDTAPPTVVPKIVAVIPHDSSVFTQGLLYDSGRLYESGGLYGKSSIRALDAQSGALIKSAQLDNRFFGEGCAKMGELLVQITWHEQTAFTWSPADLTPGSTLVYSGEGWGIASDGRFFYMSNGSDTIYVRTGNFTIVRKIPVRSQGRPVKNLNELEYVNGKIYANVWYTDALLEINPKNGNVGRRIDCRELIKREQPASPDDVLNGIAYNPETGCFYVTGKKWKNIFVVEIPKGNNR